jgi:hypothetical protein
MKSPEFVLRTALVGSTAVNAIISGRIYPLRYVGPQKIAYPLLIWRRARIERQQAFNAPVGVPRVTMELYAYAETYEAARDLADKCRVVLDGYGGTVENTEVKQAALIDEADDLVEVEGAESPLYMVKQTYDIWWQET